VPATVSVGRSKITVPGTTIAGSSAPVQPTIPMFCGGDGQQHWPALMSPPSWELAP
jgi:hypothetical protein